MKRAMEEPARALKVLHTGSDLGNKSTNNSNSGVLEDSSDFS
jgi:hypothetical protein